MSHATRDTTFKVKRSKVNLQGAGAYCGGLPHSLFNNNITKNYTLNIRANGKNNCCNKIFVMMQSQHDQHYMPNAITLRVLLKNLPTGPVSEINQQFFHTLALCHLSRLITRCVALIRASLSADL